MSHVEQHDLRQGEDKPDLDVGAIFTVGIVGTAIIVIAVLLLQAFYYGAADRQFAAAAAQPRLDVKKVTAEQLDLLAHDLVPEPGKGTIHIPIDRAIEIVAREGAHPEAVAPPAAAPGAAPAMQDNAPGVAPGKATQGKAPEKIHRSPGKGAAKP